MKFNFQKTANARLSQQREFSFREFYEKCLPPYLDSEKDKSPQYQQSQLRNEKRTISTSNIAFLESITIDFDDNFSDKNVENMLERLKSYGLCYIFYDTSSSKPDNRRFRLIFPTGERISTVEYRYIAKSLTLAIIQMKADEQSYSAHQRYRLANKGSQFNDGEPLNSIMRFDVARKKIKENAKAPRKKYERKNIAIVPYITSKYTLDLEGTRDAELHRALFHAVKLGATRQELEEIATHSTLPEKDKAYKIERLLK